MTDKKQTTWKPCRKKPVLVEFRDAVPGETVETREGILTAEEGDYIIRGVEGDVYPVGREVFNKTYDLTGAQGMTEEKQKEVKATMDSLALRIAEAHQGCAYADPRDSQALTALSLWRMDDGGLAVVVDEEEEY